MNSEMLLYISSYCLLKCYLLCSTDSIEGLDIRSWGEGIPSWPKPVDDKFSWGYTSSLRVGYASGK